MKNKKISSTETKPVLTAYPVELSFELFLSHLLSYLLNYF